MIAFVSTVCTEMYEERMALASQILYVTNGLSEPNFEAFASLTFP